MADEQTQDQTTAAEEPQKPEGDTSTEAGTTTEGQAEGQAEGQGESTATEGDSGA